MVNPVLSRWNTWSGHTQLLHLGEHHDVGGEALVQQEVAAGQCYLAGLDLAILGLRVLFATAFSIFSAAFNMS